MNADTIKVCSFITMFLIRYYSKYFNENTIYNDCYRIAMMVTLKKRVVSEILSTNGIPDEYHCHKAIQETISEFENIVVKPHYLIITPQNGVEYEVKGEWVNGYMIVKAELYDDGVVFLRNSFNPREKFQYIDGYIKNKGYCSLFERSAQMVEAINDREKI